MLKHFFYLSALFLAVKLDDGLVIQISNGQIRGRADHTVGLKKPYHAFQGIPFAQPPLENLRFKSPVPPNNWPDILNTTEYRGDCVQGADGALGGPATGSEDCLYINVYKPDINNDQKLAVMVWIYGGAYFFGTSGPQLYGPDYLLDNDVIVVTFNYRLSIFGFLSTGDLVAPGNNGLKDQALALKWVEENIAQFGGDPNSITLFGESAGAASVAYHLTSPATSVLFKNAILQSGTSLAQWALSKRMAEAVSLVAQNLNLTTDNSEELVKALKQIDASTLYDVSNNVAIQLQGNFRKGFVFAPVIEPFHSDAFITEKSHQLFAEGKFQRVPVLLGITSMEILYFFSLVSAFYLNSSINKIDLVPHNLKLQSEAANDLAHNLIKYHYFGTNESYNQTYQAFQFLSDDLFNRPVIETNRLLSQFVTTYFYEFSYVGGLSERSNHPVSGASHFDDIFYIFRKDSDATTPTDELVRSRMTRMWTNFAKYSNPTPWHDYLLDGIYWPPSNTIKNNVLYLEIDSKFKFCLNPKHHYTKFWNKIYNEFGSSPLETY